jgi:hypothetical protein
MKVLILLICSALSAVLYRMGGDEEYNTKFRDFGVPVCSYAALLIFWHPTGIIGWLMVVVSFLALFGSLTTYWKKKGSDAMWWNWALTGLFYGLAAFPLLWAGLHWWAIGLRAIALVVTITAWSESQGDVVWEERGRGALVTITMPMLLI